MASAYIDVNLHINNALLIVVSSLIGHRHTYVHFIQFRSYAAYVCSPDWRNSWVESEPGATRRSCITPDAHQLYFWPMQEHTTAGM